MTISKTPTPIFRGYDSPGLYRQDMLARIKQLEKEIQESINESSTIGNTIQLNSGNGITVAGSSSARVVGNNINSNAGHGLKVMSAAQADVSSNAINSNGGDGIH